MKGSIVPSVSVIVLTYNRKSYVLECLKSILSISYPNFDVVVVDNGSTDRTYEAIKRRFPNVRLVRNDRNLGGAEGRNLGIKNAKGEYLLFVDDDVVIDKNLLNEFAYFIQKHPKCILSPKILDYTDRSRFLGISHNINLLTGKARGIGYGEWDRGQFDMNMEVPMVGATCLFVNRKILERVGLFDETLNIPYEDSDFCLRARKCGVKVVYIYRAKVWHNARKVEMDRRLQWLGMTNPERAYFLIRNRILFLRKHSTLSKFIIFLLAFLSTYMVYYSLVTLRCRRPDILMKVLSGSLSGLNTKIQHFEAKKIV